MGNTPSSHHNGQGGDHNSPHHGRHHSGTQIGYEDLISPSSTPNPPSHHRNHPNLRLPMPSRPTHISPQSSNPTSPSGSNYGGNNRSGSPRRRKSLELPDLNKLSFTPAALTPAAPVPTTHTHTSHHLAPSTTASLSSSTNTTTTSNSIPPPSSNSTPQKKWHQTLGGRTASPLSNPNSLGAMSKLDNSIPPRSAPISMPNTNISSRPQHQQEENNNPYFPTTASQDANAVPGGRRKSIPIPIPVLGRPTNMNTSGLSPPPPTKNPTPLPPQQQDQQIQNADDGTVNVPIHWSGGGKNVYVTGDFGEKWKTRIKLHRSTHDFNTVLRLPPGQYKLKFIVDDSMICSKMLATATDDDGTLVNWIEVEAPKTEEEMRAEWAMDSKPAVKEEIDDETAWTTSIPPALTLYQYIEELPTHFSTNKEYNLFLKTIPFLPNVPSPPVLPRILDKVIVNNDTKRLWDSHDPSMAKQVGYTNAPAALDDNSILAVPNHVVLNHLTASAIRNGTLGVGTTTRYRKKYITTMFFKPTLQDMPAASVTEPMSQLSSEVQSEIPSEAVSESQSVQ